MKTPSLRKQRINGALGLAHSEMLKYAEGSPEWLYYRGLTLGIELSRKQSLVTNTWIGNILECGLGSAK